MLIYLIWGGFFLLYVFLFEFAPVYRRNIIDPQDAHASLIKIGALYVPAITAFATYWFRIGSTLSKGQVGWERWVTALVSTLAYQAIIASMTVYSLYIDAYESVDGVPYMTLEQWTANTLQLGLFLFPIATAPAAYLLGVEGIDAPKN